MTLGAFAAAAPALADSSVDPAVGDAQHSVPAGPDEQATTNALAQAKASGQAVVIDALTTPWSQTLANPDGTLTEKSNADPVRAKVSGTWQPVSTTEKENADGTFSPATTVTPVVFSGGGTGPLAILTAGDGKQLSITAPFTLPVPAASGSRLTYASVLPDVDLVVEAEPTGGIREVLVVKNATAAANPALTSLKFTTSGTGLTIASAADGELSATEADGTTAFTAPAATMWDSSTIAQSTTSTTAPSASATTTSAGTTAAAPALAQPAATTASPSTTATASPSASPSSTGTPASGTASSTEGPGAGAQVAQIPATTTGSTVTLTPPTSMLDGSGTHYPLFVDPSWLPSGAALQATTYTQSLYPGTNHLTDGGELGVGLCGNYPAGSGCSPNDTERAYFQFDTSALTGATIHSATVTFNEYDSADWSCSDTYNLELYLANGIDASTTWNNAPAESDTGLSAAVGGSGSTNCYGNVPFQYDITSIAQKAANGGWAHTAFGVHGEEGNDMAFKHLTRGATMSVQYDRTPNTPTGMTSSPTPGTASPAATQPCDATTNPTTEAFVSNPGAAGMTLKATVSSPVNQPVRGYFDLWDDSVSGFPTIASGYSSGYASSGSQVTFNLPASGLTDGHAYAWNVYTSDGLLASSTSNVCHFRYDTTPPVISSITSSDFPAAGTGQTPTKHAGDTGSFTATISDSGSGVACMRYGYDATLSTARWTCGTAAATGAISSTVPHWGTNILYVQAEDQAGNLSEIASYAFYAPWDATATKPVYGDLNGDGRADMLVPAADGNLYLHDLPGTESATGPTPQLVARAADSPDGSGWNTYQVTHRGSTTGGRNVDDVFAHKAGSGNLYLYQNPTSTPGDFIGITAAPVTKPAACAATGGCPDYNASNNAGDWSQTLQIAALGDPDSTALNAGSFAGKTGLITEETNPSGDASLWYYPVTTGRYLGAPVELAATGWKGWDLISPGDWNHSGRPGLWARNRATGTINAYTINLDGNGVPASISDTGPGIGTLSAAAYPLIGSDGDLTGTITQGSTTIATADVPDLWSTTSSGTLEVRPGITADGTATTAVTRFGTALDAGTPGGNDTWRLESTANDDDQSNPATATNANNPNTGVTWPSDMVTATVQGKVVTPYTGTVAAFNGTTGPLTTAGPVLNTAASYTITAWVKLTSANSNVQTAVSQSTVNHQAFYLGYNGPVHNWYFATTESDNPSTTFDYATGGTADTGWHHLTAVYDASSKIMSLYVDGTLVGAARNTSPVSESDSHLNIGGNYATNGPSPYNQWSGSISHVQTYPTAMTASQVASLAAATQQ